MLNAFGRNYEEIGSSDKGLILKNSGKVKILWGKSFIDLLDNNGKLNVKVEKLIKLVNSDENINEDGFYFVNGIIKAKIGESIVELASNQDLTYISFLLDQSLSGEERYKALLNIGLVYKDVNEVENFPTNGIIYNEKDSSLYIILEGIINKYLAPIQNIIDKLFIISKSNSDDTLGALVIRGKGTENSILFDSLLIYSLDDLNTIINYKTNLIFNSNDRKILELNKDKILVFEIESINYSEYNGFKIYPINGKYYLDIDGITVRDFITLEEVLIPLTIYDKENIISNILLFEDSETPSEILYKIILKYKNTYSVGDTIKFYVDSDKEGIIEIKGVITDIDELENIILNSVIFTSKQCGKSEFSDLESYNEKSFKRSLDSIRNIPCFLLANKNLIIGELDSNDKYNNKNCGIISKLNIFYSAKFMKENDSSFSLNNYPFYDDALITDLENNINNLPDGVLIPAKLFKALEARVSALEN